jgi:hypothetical protein
MTDPTTGTAFSARRRGTEPTFAAMATGAMHWKDRITVELLLGITATLLSLGALVVTVVQTAIAREQQRASVWPYLLIDDGRFDDKITVRVENKGVGPALVRQVMVTSRGQPAPTLKSLLNSQIPGYTGPRLTGALSPGSVLKSGEELILFQIDRDAKSADRLESFLAEPTFVLRVVYSDVYGNCWAATSRAVEPARCP